MAILSSTSVRNDQIFRARQIGRGTLEPAGKYFLRGKEKNL